MIVNNIQHHIETMRLYVFDGFNAARHCHNLIFSDEKKSEKINVALAYLNQANTFITNAKTIYRLISEEREKPDLDDFFHQFEVFNKEVLTNVRTNHSHQWSGIEFNRLKERYEDIKGLLNLTI